MLLKVIHNFGGGGGSLGFLGEVEFGGWGVFWGKNVFFMGFFCFVEVFSEF